jgi:hypothetical protein
MEPPHQSPSRTKEFTQREYANVPFPSCSQRRQRHHLYHLVHLPTGREQRRAIASKKAKENQSQNGRHRPAAHQARLEPSFAEFPAQQTTDSGCRIWPRQRFPGVPGGFDPLFSGQAFEILGIPHIIGDGAEAGERPCFGQDCSHSRSVSDQRPNGVIVIAAEFRLPRAAIFKQYATSWIERAGIGTV